MIKCTLLYSLLAILLLCAVRDSGADSYRCGQKLIRTGDSPADVLRVCGEPRRRDRGLESVVLDGAPQRLTVERWYYRQGSRSLEHVVMLHRGQVVRIVVGGR
jgi:hypothetical protein